MKMLSDDKVAKWSVNKVCSGKGWNQETKPCNRLLNVSDYDIQYRDHTDYREGTDRHYEFTCPICGCFTEIDEKEIPSYAKNNASKYEEHRELNMISW